MNSTTYVFCLYYWSNSLSETSLGASPMHKHGQGSIFWANENFPLLSKLVLQDKWQHSPYSFDYILSGLWTKPE